MLTATEFYEVTTLLKVVLWIEVVIYLGLGVYEIFNDFFYKPRNWAIKNGKHNSYIYLVDRTGIKMHAAIFFILGFVVLKGVIEGQVTRFESYCKTIKGLRVLNGIMS